MRDERPSFRYGIRVHPTSSLHLFTPAIFSSPSVLFPRHKSMMITLPSHRITNRSPRDPPTPPIPWGITRLHGERIIHRDETLALILAAVPHGPFPSVWDRSSFFNVLESPLDIETARGFCHQSLDDMKNPDDGGQARREVSRMPRPHDRELSSCENTPWHTERWARSTDYRPSGRRPITMTSDVALAGESQRHGAPNRWDLRSTPTSEFLVSESTYRGTQGNLWNTNPGLSSERFEGRFCQVAKSRVCTSFVANSQPHTDPLTSSAEGLFSGVVRALGMAFVEPRQSYLSPVAQPPSLTPASLIAPLQHFDRPFKSSRTTPNTEVDETPNLRHSCRRWIRAWHAKGHLSGTRYRNDDPSIRYIVPLALALAPPSHLHSPTLQKMWRKVIVAGGVKLGGTITIRETRLGLRTQVQH
ncbi:hypothetical protein NMY22_g8869 [Coprinellus aureogranulatus]|nr:hypothetical protein NMY22_g8869 [Coprinellus aureogranulatus]